jgi:hypothetical protein
MKNKTFYAVFIGLVFWNVWLSLPEKKESEPINYELYKKLFEQSERRFRRVENEIKKIDYEIFKDSSFVVNASPSERDSIRARLNPR